MGIRNEAGLRGCLLTYHLLHCSHSPTHKLNVTLTRRLQGVGLRQCPLATWVPGYLARLSTLPNTTPRSTLVPQLQSKEIEGPDYAAPLTAMGSGCLLSMVNAQPLPPPPWLTSPGFLPSLDHTFILKTTSNRSQSCFSLYSFHHIPTSAAAEKNT